LAVSHPATDEVSIVLLKLYPMYSSMVAAWSFSAATTLSEFATAWPIFEESIIIINTTGIRIPINDKNIRNPAASDFFQPLATSFDIHFLRITNNVIAPRTPER